MDPLAQEDTSDCDIDSSTNLQFPTIQVYGTPASWLSQSHLIQSRLLTANMSSPYDTHNSCDEVISSLGDSAYDFVDDRSTTTDEDEVDRMTASTSSVAESTSSETFEADQQPLLPTPQARPPHVQIDAEDTDSDESLLNLKTPTCDNSQADAPGPSEAIAEEQSLAYDPDEPIEFEEPSVINLNTSRFTEVSHTLRIIEKPHQVTGNLLDLVKRLPAVKISVMVRQTMTTQGMDLRSTPYKLLFVGAQSLKEPVIQKIGEALAAGSRSSTSDCNDARPNKFNIVPVSGFGDSKHPEVVLVGSSGLEMTVEDCTSAKSSTLKDGKDTISLQMADGVGVRSRWVDSRYVTSDDWTLPDLAVFCTSEDETKPAKDTRHFARSFMHRHGVPTLVIEKQATWDKHNDEATWVNLDYLTPHLYLEYRQTEEQNYHARRRYPVDLATFLCIDAGQLNRNLASLAASKRLSQTRALPQIKNVKSNSNVWYSDAMDNIRAINGWESLQDSTLRFSLFLLLLFTSLSFGLALCYMEVTSGFPGASISSATSSMTPIATTWPIVPDLNTLIESSPFSAPSQTSLSKGLTSHTDLDSILMDAHTLEPDKADQFVVQVLGDRHIVVNSPRWLRKTKAPDLFFKVSRQEQAIDHQLSTLGKGVFALQISHEEATGKLNVSMTILSKVVRQEMFEVDFGSPWLDIPGWKRAAHTISYQIHKKIRIAYTAFDIVCNQTTAELSTFVQQTKTKLADQRTVEHAFFANCLEWGTQTRDVVLERTSNLSTSLSHRLRARQKQVQQHFHFLKENVTQSLYVYTRNQTFALSHQALDVTRLISKSRLGASDLARERLKDAQKRALRAWWKIVGVPKTSRLPRLTHRRVQGEDEKLYGERVFSCF